MYYKSLKNKEKIFAVAPMMDWTDRHCRYFHRQLSDHALLYTEMVVADAVIHGERERLLGFRSEEQPLAVQLGGSDPSKLAKAATVCAEWGYGEINLNVGCPSDRVQSGTFGACLMEQPHLVADCVKAMKDAVSEKISVTVKCRIGVDDQDPKEALPSLAHAVWGAGCDALWVHARKAWLQGLSPKENRDIPPLDYDLVRSLKADNPDRFVGINGGIDSLETCADLLKTLDGVILGLAPYQKPDLLRGVYEAIYGAPHTICDYWDESEAVIQAMADHCSAHIQSGGRLHHVTRHMVGLFHGLPGARQWRRSLSEGASQSDVRVELLWDAFNEVRSKNQRGGSEAA